MIPKININGIVRDMTPEEIAELERQADEIPERPQADMEKRIAELEGALEVLLGGVT